MKENGINDKENKKEFELKKGNISQTETKNQEPNNYKYYFDQNALNGGAYPIENFRGIKEYSESTHIPEINRNVWGELAYSMPLTKELEKEYGLISSPSNIREYEKKENIQQMVQTNMGKIPIEDYREIVAQQHGFDSYGEMYKEGIRIGNGYDMEPEKAQAVNAEEPLKLLNVTQNGEERYFKLNNTVVSVYDDVLQQLKDTSKPSFVSLINYGNANGVGMSEAGHAGLEQRAYMTSVTVDLDKGVIKVYSSNVDELDRTDNNTHSENFTISKEIKAEDLNKEREIKKEIMKGGYQPTKRLVEDMKQVNAAFQKEHSVKEVRDLCKSKDSMSSEKKELLQKTANDFIQAEQTMKKPPVLEMG